MGSVDGLFLTFCGYISAQYGIVESDIRTLRKEGKVKITSLITTGQENDKILLVLAEIVEKHNRVISLNNEFSKIFEINIIVQFIISAVHMAALGAAFLFADNFSEASIFLAFITADLIQLFIYCYGGSLIIESVSYLFYFKNIPFNALTLQSEAIAVAVYEFDWYAYDKHVAKTIQLLLLRSQKGNMVYVAFFKVDLNTLLNVRTYFL